MAADAGGPPSPRPATGTLPSLRSMFCRFPLPRGFPLSFHSVAPLMAFPEPPLPAARPHPARGRAQRHCALCALPAGPGQLGLRVRRAAVPAPRAGDRVARDGDADPGADARRDRALPVPPAAPGRRRLGPARRGAQQRLRHRHELRRAAHLGRDGRGPAHGESARPPVAAGRRPGRPALEQVLAERAGRDAVERRESDTGGAMVRLEACRGDKDARMLTARGQAASGLGADCPLGRSIEHHWRTPC